MGILNTRGDSRGCPPWVHFFVLDPRSWREKGIGGNKRINKGMSRGDITCLVLTVSGWTAEGWSILRTNLLAACCPWKSKSRLCFGSIALIPCMDQRKKVVQELKGLPKCDLTGFSQILGEDCHWNQMVFRLHAPRGNHCHHCHRLMDHWLSVRERRVLLL